jgi:predicted transcriptional regulator
MINPPKKGEIVTMEIVNLNIRLDKQLRTDFQIICKKQDTTASAVLRKYIEQYVNENK